MYERLKRLYDSGALTLEGLKNAVKKGLITPEEYAQICLKEYDEDDA